MPTLPILYFTICTPPDPTRSLWSYLILTDPTWFYLTQYNPTWSYAIPPNSIPPSWSFMYCRPDPYVYMTLSDPKGIATDPIQSYLILHDPTYSIWPCLILRDPNLHNITLHNTTVHDQNIQITLPDPARSHLDLYTQYYPILIQDDPAWPNITLPGPAQSHLSQYNLPDPARSHLIQYNPTWSCTIPSYPI